MANPLIVDWELQLNTWPRKFIAIVLILGISGALIYHTWWIFLGAWITREFQANPAVYERANRYDPDNVLCASSPKGLNCYHFLLAQLYNSSTQYLDTKRAGEEFKEAVRLNPNRTLHWQELAK